MDIREVEKRVRMDEAEQLEAYRKGQAEAPVMYRAATFDISETKAQNDDSEQMVFVASTEDVDRGGDLVRQDGWELANFKRNPVYQWAHNYSIPPLGTVPRVWVEGKNLVNTVQFDMDDPFAADIERKFRAKILRAQSVGFRALEFEERKNNKGFFADFEFLKQELLEISAVPIPMNQRALRKAIELADAAPVYFFQSGTPSDTSDTSGTVTWTASTDPDYSGVDWNQWAKDLNIYPTITDTTDEPVAEVKAGRTLSTRNFNRLKEAADAIADVLVSATPVDSDDEIGDEPEPTKAIDTADEPVVELEQEQTGLSGEDAERIRQKLKAVTEEI